MQSYYLDANIIRNLAEASSPWRKNARALRSLVGVGAWAILGSLELLEELTSLACSDAERYGQAVALFWSIVGDRVLRPTGKLMEIELRTGAAAARAEAYLDSATIANMRALSSDRSGMASLREDVRRLKSEDEKLWNDIGDGVERELTARARGGQAPSGDAGPFFCEKSVQSWFLTLARSQGKRLGLSANHTDQLRVSRLPCSRASVSFCMAQILRRHRSGTEQRFRANDFYDRRHYTLAAMAGCFVTEDRALRRTVGEIGYEPLPVMTGEEFSRRLVNDVEAGGAALRG